MSVERPRSTRPQREVCVNGSRAEIYDIDSILIKRDGEAKIYDERRFPGTAIRSSQITVEHEPSEDEENGAYIYNATISLKRLADPSFAANKIKLFYRSVSIEEPDPDISSVEKTKFNNTFIINRPNRQTLLLYVFDKNNEVTIGLSNQKTLHGEGDKNNTVEVKADAGRNQIQELSSFSLEFIRAMDVAAFSNSPHASGKLNHVYEIGKSIQYPIREPKKFLPKPQEKNTTRETVKKEESSSDIGKLLVAKKYTFDDIGGLFEAKQKMREITLLRDPEITEKWGVTPPSSVLLHGDKGKTMLAHALANDLGADLFEVKSTDFATKWIGESEKNLSELFDKFISYKKPHVLYFHNIHTIVNPAHGSSGGGDDTRNKVAEAFRRKVPELIEKNKDAFIVASANMLDSVDESIAELFNRKVAVTTPDMHESADILSLLITQSMRKHNDNDIDYIEGKGESQEKAFDTRIIEVYARNNFRQFGEDLNIPELAKMGSGLNGHDWNRLIAQVLTKKAAEEFIQKKLGGKVGPVTQEEFAKAIRSYYHH